MAVVMGSFSQVRLRLRVWLLVLCGVVLGCCVGLLVFAGGVAWGAVAWWKLDSVSMPGNFVPGSRGKLMVTAMNLGGGSVVGVSERVVLRDVLPAGVTAKSVLVARTGRNGKFLELPPVSCVVVSGGSVVECGYEGVLPPYELLEVLVEVEVSSEEKSAVNEVSVVGGGAAAVSFKRPLVVSSAATRFGLAAYEMGLFNENGSLDTQAGSHPFEFTSTFDFNRTGSKPFVPALVKDVRTRLPPGLVGNPTALPQCSDAQFERNIGGEVNECPGSAAVGVAVVTIDEEELLRGFATLTVPVFNLTPSAGEPARFGFDVLGTLVALDTAVGTGGDYGVTVSATNTPEVASLLSAQVTVWGVPGDRVHDESRGWECLTGGSWRIVIESVGQCKFQEQAFPPAFLSLPTSCTGPLATSVAVDSWAAPHEVLSFGPSVPVQALDGCNRLPFEPSIRLTPDGTAGSTPTGVNVDVHVPQEETLNAHGLAESDPRALTVTLPEGLAVNPADGDGLAACTGNPGLLPEGALGSLGDEVGYKGTKTLSDVPGETATFSPGLPSPLEPGVDFCPDASKVATVTIRTPLLPHPIEGAVYLATQNQNPFGSLVAMYIVAEDPVSGVLIKQAQEVHLSGTGQITATFKNIAQAPFEDAEVHFFGGERAPLATPARCGPYTTTAALTPWSSEEPVRASSTFQITSGPGGSPCPGSTLPFSPTLHASSSNIQAGGFTPFTTTISRADGNQDMQVIQVDTPPGFAGLISSVTPCPEAQANEGTCGPASEIGETTVSAGVGGDPITVTGGKVYITEKYAGAPFGLSIVNPVKAGPFDLERDTSNPAQNPPCDCIVVRAKIQVDPNTADLTITTDPTGPHAIPRLIDGIPVQIKHVNVTINRKGFTFNPTNCNPSTVTGSITGDEGATQPVQVPFQVTNCALLNFSPKLTVSTGRSYSRVNGASLSLKIAYPPGAMGSQAWLHAWKFVVPKQLPARLTTLQESCLAKTFETNPAACPPHSLIGHVLVHTQLLPVPLTGPIYFVARGKQFPDAITVLQGDNITVDITTETFIKNGITSATTPNIPGVPFETTEITIPAGPHSEFTGNLPTKTKNSFCGQKLTTPTLFTAQNGQQTHQNTPITPTSCPTHKHKTKHTTHKKK